MSKNAASIAPITEQARDLFATVDVSADYLQSAIGNQGDLMFKEAVKINKKILIMTYLIFLILGTVINSSLMSDVRSSCRDQKLMSLETSEGVQDVYVLDCRRLGLSNFNAVLIEIVNFPVSIITLGEFSLRNGLSKVTNNNAWSPIMIVASNTSVIGKLKKTTVLGVLINSGIFTLLFAGRAKKIAAKLPFKIN